MAPNKQGTLIKRLPKKLIKYSSIKILFQIPWKILWTIPCTCPMIIHNLSLTRKLTLNVVISTSFIYTQDTTRRLTFTFWSLSSAIFILKLPILNVYVLIRSYISNVFSTNPMSTRRSTLTSTFLWTRSAIFSLAFNAASFQVASYIL